MQRIVIIGTTGSGKTTLARNIAKRCGHDFLDIDEFHWLPNWQERDPDERFALCDAATNAPRWAISGNYSKLRDMIWAKADTVVWLNYSTPRTFWQLAKRSFSRAWTGDKICNGNVETFGKLFSKDSIFVWFFKSHWKRRRDARALLDNPQAWPHITFLRFTSPKETEKWLHTLPSSPP